MSSNLVVFAENHAQMIESQLQMVEWASGKLAEHQGYLAEATENLEIATTNKWKISGWKNVQRVARKKVEFYEKIHANLVAGYVIVPNFPMDIFAIRTLRHFPVEQYEVNTQYWNTTDRLQRGQSLPIGQGHYVDSEPNETTMAMDTNEKGETIYGHWAESFRDIDFPIKAVKPVILDRTSKALQAKVFDEIGILPGRPAFQRRMRGLPGKDPMVIGRVIYSKNRWSGDKSVSFLICWWLNAGDLEV